MLRHKISAFGTRPEQIFNNGCLNYVIAATFAEA